LNYGCLKRDPLTKTEITSLIQAAEEEIVLSIFVKHWESLSQKERKEILSSSKVSLPTITPYEVTNAIKSVERNTSGRLIFPSLQDALSKFLADKLDELKMEIKKPGITHVPGTRTIMNRRAILNNPEFASSITYKSVHERKYQLKNMEMINDINIEVDKLATLDRRWKSY
jgi:hypothetical protein